MDWAEDGGLPHRRMHRSILLRALLMTLVVATLVRHGMAAQRAEAPKSVDQAAIDAALDRGIEHLHDEYRRHVERGDLDEERVGMTALALYTLLKCGVAADDEVVQRLLAHIQFQRIDREAQRLEPDAGTWRPAQGLRGDVVRSRQACDT